MKKTALSIITFCLLSIISFAQESLGPGVNTEENEGFCVIAPDGKTIYFSRSWSDPCMMFSNFENGQWQPARKMPPHINSVDTRINGISRDGNTIYFSNKSDSLYASDKTNNGWGKPYPMLMKGISEISFSSSGKVAMVGSWFKICVAFQKSDGKWSDLVKLPENINSSVMQTSPFLAIDDKTLFFTREHGSRTEIMVTYRLDDTWLNWSDPVTIEAAGIVKFNSRFTTDASASECRLYYFTIDALGEYGYFYYYNYKEEQNPGHGDVYRIKLKLKPLLRKDEPENISDMKLTIGMNVKLNNVLFEKGTPTLLSSSYVELDKLVALMQENTAMEIELSGHTDNQGDPAINMKLSEERVEVVKKYLVSKGIDASRIQGKGYGGTKPVAPNDSELNRQKNRRVEFVVLKY